MSLGIFQGFVSKHSRALLSILLAHPLSSDALHELMIHRLVLIVVRAFIIRANQAMQGHFLDPCRWLLKMTFVLEIAIVDP